MLIIESSAATAGNQRIFTSAWRLSGVRITGVDGGTADLTVPARDELLRLMSAVARGDLVRLS